MCRAGCKIFKIKIKRNVFYFCAKMWLRAINRAHKKEHLWVARGAVVPYFLARASGAQKKIPKHETFARGYRKTRI